MDCNISNIKYVKSPTYINGVKVVNDIQEAIEELKKGNTIARFEYGESMSPILKSGEYCIIEPIKEYENIQNISVGDAVLCKVGEHLMTHMVMMASTYSNCDKPYYLIGNTWMQYYGWTSEIYGIAKGTNILEEPINFEEINEIKEN